MRRPKEAQYAAACAEKVETVKREYEALFEKAGILGEDAVQSSLATILGRVGGGACFLVVFEKLGQRILGTSAP